MTGDVDIALTAAVKEVAAAKVAEALGGDILTKMVESVMNHTGSYGGRDRKTMFEELVDGQIRALLEEAVRAHLAAYRDQFNAVIATALTEHADRVATGVLDAIVSDDWRANLTVTVEREKRD